MRRLLAALCLTLLLGGMSASSGLGQSAISIAGPVNVVPSTLAVTAVSTANASVTATLPAAGTGLFHYITALRIVRTCTTAITGSAVLTITSTNLPGTLAWTSGNACPVGTTNVVMEDAFRNPLRSSVANTNTTIVCPAVGATGICRVTAIYFTAP